MNFDINAAYRNLFSFVNRDTLTLNTLKRRRSLTNVTYVKRPS